MACSIVIVSTASAELCLLTSLIGGIVATGALIIVFREIVMTRMLESMDSVLLTTAAMI